MATHTSKLPQPNVIRAPISHPCPKCEEGELVQLDNDRSGAEQCTHCRYTTGRWSTQATSFDACPSCGRGEMLSPDGTDRWTECNQCGHTVNATKW